MPVTDNFGRRRLIQAKVDIDEETLSEVAEKTGAIYFRATNTASLSKIYDEINKMETTTRTIKKFESYRELFLFFVLAALSLLGLEIFQSRKKLP
jgi:Ca-activated chloride channel family protein